MNKKWQQVFDKCTDIDYLKNYILDYDGSDSLLTSADQTLMKRFIFPKKHHLDLCRLARHYGAKFSLCKYSKFIGGQYHRHNNLIAIYTDKNKLVSTHKICRVFPHELAHHIQYSIMQEELGSHCEILFETLSQKLLYEQVADRLAYFLYKKHFKHIWDIPHQAFRIYHNKNLIKKLAKQCKVMFLEIDIDEYKDVQ